MLRSFHKYSTANTFTHGHVTDINKEKYRPMFKHCGTPVLENTSVAKKLSTQGGGGGGGGT